MTPTCPEASRPAGGVAIAAHRSLACEPIVPRTSLYRQAFEQGRALICHVSMGARMPVLLATYYGWASDSIG
eukprot:8977325-Alexandrium_andersonii.AAC.1